MPPDRSKRGTSYDRFGDLRERAESRQRNQVVAIVASLAGMAGLVWVLQWVLSR
jgi:hypothetical protein